MVKSIDELIKSHHGISRARGGRIPIDHGLMKDPKFREKLRKIIIMEKLQRPKKNEMEGGFLFLAPAALAALGIKKLIDKRREKKKKKEEEEQLRQAVLLQQTQPTLDGLDGLDGVDGVDDLDNDGIVGDESLDLISDIQNEPTPIIRNKQH